jgi:hypothetical protein
MRLHPSNSLGSRPRTYCKQGSNNTNPTDNPRHKSQTSEPRKHRTVINPTIYATASLVIDSSCNLAPLAGLPKLIWESLLLRKQYAVCTLTLAEQLTQPCPSSTLVSGRRVKRRSGRFLIWLDLWWVAICRCRCRCHCQWQMMEMGTYIWRGPGYHARLYHVDITIV